MNTALKILTAVPVLIYYLLEALVLSIIPNKFLYRNINGETVLITGAGSGIGRQMALKFARLGTRLVLLDIDSKGLEETQKLVYQEIPDVFVYVCDVSKKDEVYAVAERIKKEVGNINILINNAGIVTGKKLLDAPDEKIIKTFEVNSLAHFWTCKAFLPAMVKANYGHLVFVSSLAAYGGAARLTDYVASKHAVLGLVESLRLELVEEKITGVKTTIVCPYLIHTGLFEGFQAWIHKGLTPEYVAERVVDAVLTEKNILIIPSYMQVFVFLKTFLPASAVKELLMAAGLAESMLSFTGRKNS